MPSLFFSRANRFAIAVLTLSNLHPGPFPDPVKPPPPPMILHTPKPGCIKFINRGQTSPLGDFSIRRVDDTEKKKAGWFTQKKHKRPQQRFITPFLRAKLKTFAHIFHAPKRRKFLLGLFVSFLLFTGFRRSWRFLRIGGRLETPGTR